ncbi:MAG: hypothetical protein ACK4MQ_07420 [Hyphomonas sp.]
MLKTARLLLPLLLLTAAAACHTDPFSMKPEVRGLSLPDHSEPPPEPEEEAPVDAEE